MTRQDRTILVTGATGKQGGATARQLLAEGWAVRALVRDPQAAAARALAADGAETAVGDLDSPETLEAAVAGVHGVFAVPPTEYRPQERDGDLEYARGRRLVDAAAAAGAAHTVFASIASVPEPDLPGSGDKRRTEAHLGRSGMRWTVLRPVRFMENYLMRDTAFDGVHRGVHRHMFHPERPMQVIAVEDIAVFAALAFADPDRYDGRTLELAGDGPTPVEAAAAISAAVGRTVRYEQVPLEEAAGFGPEIAETWRLWNSGHTWRADVQSLRELHPGLRTLEDWLAGSGAALIRALPVG